MVLNAAARLIYRRRKFDHVSPLLEKLHWLRVPERIIFRLAVLAYRCMAKHSVLTLRFVENENLSYHDDTILYSTNTISRIDTIYHNT